MNDKTYFDHQATIDPFFIIAGCTDDDFCTDMLHVTTLPMELHHHLRRKGGASGGGNSPSRSPQCRELHGSRCRGGRSRSG